jgi:hypothetical protein
MRDEQIRDCVGLCSKEKGYNLNGVEVDGITNYLLFGCVISPDNLTSDHVRSFVDIYQRGKGCKIIGSPVELNHTDYSGVYDLFFGPLYPEIIVNSKGFVYDRLESGLRKSMITAILKSKRGNQVKAAEDSGLSRNTVRQIIKEHDLVNLSYSNAP